ncbi:hypothetical protein DL95DRAFT_473578 [Leptodontidium sp. 2 PMI_412]|nr:hypothetical protein DL95DRAFT_473578 [Leptodontidium sp. 2 PMI_412]
MPVPDVLGSIPASLAMGTPTNPNVMSLDTMMSPSPAAPTSSQKPARTALPDSKQKPPYSMRAGLAEPASEEIPGPPSKRQAVTTPVSQQMHTSNSNKQSLAMPSREQISAAQSRKPSLVVSANEENPYPQSKNSDPARPTSDQVPSSQSTRISSSFAVQSPRFEPTTSESRGPATTWGHGFKIYFSKDDVAKLAAKTDPIVKVMAITSTSNNVRLTTDTGITEPHPPLYRGSSYADPLPVPTDQMNPNSSELLLARSSTRTSAQDTTIGAARSSLSALASSNSGLCNPEETYPTHHSSRLEVPPSTLPNKARSRTGSMVEVDVPPQMTKPAPKRGRPPKPNGISRTSNSRQASDQYTSGSDRMSPTFSSGANSPVQTAVAEKSQRNRKRKNVASTEGAESVAKKPRQRPQRERNRAPEKYSEGSWHEEHIRHETNLKRAEKGLPPEDS